MPIPAIPASAVTAPPATRRLERLMPLVMMALLLTLAGCAGPQLATRDAGGLSMDRAVILAEARQALGTPYRYGGTDASGLDCSGLVQRVYSRAGITVPRTSRRQFERLPSTDEARPGDLLFFDTAGGGDASHVGIYLGDDEMIHAPGRGRRVSVTSLSLAYWQQRYLGAAAPAP